MPLDLLRDPPIGLLTSENRPDHSSILVGDRDDSPVEAATFAQLIDPGTLRVRLPSRSPDHSSSAVDDERAKVLVTTLADPKELRAITTGVLPRYEAKPGRHVPPILEVAPISDGGDDSRGYLRSHTFDLGDPLSEGARSEGLVDLDGLVDDRDRLLVNALNSFINARADEPIVVGVVYGAGHMPAVVRALAASGFKPMKAEWLTVFGYD